MLTGLIVGKDRHESTPSGRRQKNILKDLAIQKKLCKFAVPKQKKARHTK